MWLNDTSCEGVIKDSWGEHPVLDSIWGFNRKIMACQGNLKEWNKKCFGHVRNTLAKKLKELKSVEEDGSYVTNPYRIYSLREEIQKLKGREESMWKQRSRNAWLKKGDSNSRYFHCRATQLNRRNFIVGLEDGEGVWIKDEAQMGGIIEEYFRSIYTTSNPSGINEILNEIQLALTKEAAVLLGRDFNVEEVRIALSQMAPLTAPGLGGMSPIFYKSFWHIVG